MKIKITYYSFPILLSICFLVGCQNNHPRDSKYSEEKAAIQKWLSFSGNASMKKNKKIVLVSGDEEYRSEEALPQIAKILSTHHGFDCTVLFAQDPAHPGIVDPNFTDNIPGLDALNDADLMVVFTRFRALPDEQMQHFQNYLMKGKPVIGIRTATHAFNVKDTTNKWRHWGNYFNEDDSDWNGGFGRKILGNNWYTHHGHHKHQSTRGIFAPGEDPHWITQGIEDGAIWGPTDVYGVPGPLPGDGQPIILGQVVNRAGTFDEKDLLYGMRDTDTEVATINPATKTNDNPNDPMMPIVWSKSYQLEGGQTGTAITSTIGSSTDMLNEQLRRLFVNATYYLLEISVPEKAKVDLVGKYNPSQFQFQTDEYWEEKGVRIEEIR